MWSRPNRSLTMNWIVPNSNSVAISAGGAPRELALKRKEYSQRLNRRPCAGKRSQKASAAKPPSLRLNHWELCRAPEGNLKIKRPLFHSIEPCLPLFRRFVCFDLDQGASERILLHFRERVADRIQSLRTLP
jgi:hypothetical protein